MAETRLKVFLNGHNFEVVLPRDHQYFEDNWRAWESNKTEKRTLEFASRRRADTIFLDVGAWIGCITLLAAKSNKKVYSFEADPVSVEDLKRNISNNHLQNVTVIPKLVSDRNGIQTIYSTASGNNAGSSVLISDGKSSWSIEAIRLDEFIAKNTSASDAVVVKMDIEGSEYAVLPTIKRLIDSGKIVEMCLSLHPHLIANTIKGQGLGAKIRRRLRLTLTTLSALRSVGGFKYMRNANGRPQSKAALLWEIITTGGQSEDNLELFLSNSVE